MIGSKGMYKDSPRFERDKETGKMGASKPNKPEAEKKSDEASGQEEGVVKGDMPAHDRREMAHKHIKEHMDLHHKHETQHSLHKGGKAELHARHIDEKKALHASHEKETAEMQNHHDTTGEDMIEHTGAKE